MLLKRIIAALALPLLLTSCLLTPGKFTSTLAIHADRGFAFTYQGEVIAIDPSQDMAKGMTGGDKPDPADAAADNRAIAEALTKEEGYKSVRYVGNGKFIVDYAIAGKLDHGFVYPFNMDSQAIFPFLAIELRKDGAVRVMAPGFAASQPKMPGMDDVPDTGGGNSALDGTFTLTTDAEIVMHNSEDGVKPAGAMKTLTWRATPLTKTAPTAVLRLRP